MLPIFDRPTGIAMHYIKGFDSLRAISIILVISGHLGLYALLPEQAFWKTRAWHLISGTTGVQVFFTLSGFLITSILLHEKNQNGRIHFGNFYARRFLRLLPPLIVFFTVIAILMHQGVIKSTGTGFLFSVCYLYNFVPTYYYTVELGHTWSLALEEQFYLIWPFVIQFIKNYSQTLWLITITFLVCVFSGALYAHLTWIHAYTPERWFIPAVAPVLAGSFFGILNTQNPAGIKRYFQKKWQSAALSSLLFICPLYLPLGFMEYAAFFQAIGISILVVWIFHNQQARFVRALENPVLCYIGKISYGLYVYQGLFLRTGPGSEWWFQQFPQNLFLTVGVAVLSFEFLEKQFVRAKKKFRN